MYLKFLTLLFLSISVSSVKFNVLNKCPETIWPAVFGQQHTPSESGFKLNSGESKDINVPEGWIAGRFWARTGCTGSGEDFHCETGACGTSEKCNGKTGEIPASLAEISLTENGDL